MNVLVAGATGKTGMRLVKELTSSGHHPIALVGELGAWIDCGAVKPVIGTIFSFDQSAAAYEELANGHAAGKIVVTLR